MGVLFEVNPYYTNTRREMMERSWEYDIREHKQAPLVLLFFKYVSYATKEQLVQFAGLPSNTQEVRDLYYYGYLDAAKIPDITSKFIFWIDTKGIKVLKDLFGVVVPPRSESLRQIIHTLGVAQCILEEMKFGFDSLNSFTTSARIGNIRPDLYIERGKDIYFVEFDNGTESMDFLKEKFKAYNNDKYVISNPSHLRVYYYPKGRRETIIRALKLAEMSNLVSVEIKYLDIASVLGVPAEVRNEELGAELSGG